MWYPFVKQEQTNDCGYACLAMLIEYYHQKTISVEDIKINHPQQVNALSIYSLNQIAMSYKIELFAYEVAPSEFCGLTIKEPIIAYMLNEQGEYHYIVVYKNRKKSYLVGDPSQHRLYWISEAEFLKAFQNVMIYSEKKANIVYKNLSFLLLFTFLKEYKIHLCALLCLGLFVNFLLILNKSFIKIYLDQLAKQIDSEIILIFLTFLLLFFFRTILNYFFERTMLKLQQKISKKMLTIFMRNIDQLSILEFTRYSKGEWLKRQEDIAILAKLLGSHLFQILFNFCMMSISLILLFNISYLILLIIILENLLNFILALCFSYINRLMYEKWYQKGLKLEEQTLQLYDSFKDRKARNLTNHFYLQWSFKLNNFVQENYSFERIGMLQNISFRILNQLANFLIFYLAINLIFNQKIGIGDLMFYSALSLFIGDFSNSIAGLLSNRSKYYKAFLRTKQLLFAPKIEPIYHEITEKITEINITSLRYEINDEPILNGISCLLHTTVFLKGKSGCGKTSLLEIITKIRAFTKGDILINNHYSLHGLSPISIANKIILLHQDGYLFAGTVYDNLINFQQTTNYELLNHSEIRIVLARNNLILDKKIVSGGDNLSQGQKQIILFINLLLQEKDVYILDEALSNVDQVSRTILIQLLMKIKFDKIIIYAGHDRGLEQYFALQINLEELNQ